MVTSSAVVGSSAISSVGLQASAIAIVYALAHTAGKLDADTASMPALPGSECLPCAKQLYLPPASSRPWKDCRWSEMDFPTICLPTGQNRVQGRSWGPGRSMAIFWPRIFCMSFCSLAFTTSCSGQIDLAFDAAAAGGNRDLSFMIVCAVTALAAAALADDRQHFALVSASSVTPRDGLDLARVGVERTRARWPSPEYSLPCRITSSGAVKRVAQAVAQQVECQHRQADAATAGTTSWYGYVMRQSRPPSSASDAPRRACVQRQRPDRCSARNASRVRSRSEWTSVTRTMTNGKRAFGHASARATMRAELFAPMASAATIYSWALSWRTWPRQCVPCRSSR